MRCEKIKKLVDGVGHCLGVRSIRRGGVLQSIFVTEDWAMLLR